jgi:hypothetical protein
VGDDALERCAPVHFSGVRTIHAVVLHSPGYLHVPTYGYIGMHSPKAAIPILEQVHTELHACKRCPGLGPVNYLPTYPSALISAPLHEALGVGAT